MDFFVVVVLFLDDNGGIVRICHSKTTQNLIMFQFLCSVRQYTRRYIDD